jgi:putative transposase
VIDFWVSWGESEQAWEGFLNDLCDRGLDGEGLEMIVKEGAKELLAAFSVVYPHVAIQRFWAHKSRNVLSYLPKVDHGAIKKDLQQIHHAASLKEAQKALGRFSERWRGQYPKAVRFVIEDEEELLSFFKIKERSFWPKMRTANAIERRFREVKRRTRPTGVFSDRTSIERILYAMFTYQNPRQGTLKPFITLTQNS